MQFPRPNQASLSRLGLTLVMAATAVSLKAEVRIPIQKKVLNNGMTVLLVERHNAPVFSAQMVFKTGSADNPTGAFGLAHVCEHMFFKGTTSFGLKNPEDYKKEEALLQKQDALFEAILKEQRSLEEISARQFFSTGKPGPKNSPKLDSLKKEFEAAQAEHRALVATNEYMSLLSSAGSNGIGGGTAMDFTAYNVSLPKNRFEFWCRLESDRLANPVVREFYKEMDVIKEERRSRIEDGSISPFGVLDEPFLAAAFPYHPYGRNGIGPMSDLSHIRRSDVHAFFKTYYAPNQAAIVLVGDLKMNEILPSIEAYFGKIPRQPDPKPMHTVSPEQNGEKRIVVEKDLTPMLQVGWHVPAMSHPDVPALNVLTQILANSRTSRLYKSAVEGKKLATQFSMHYGFPGSKYPSLIQARATVNGDHTTQELEALLDEEIEKLKKEGPTQAEMARVLKRAEMDNIAKLESPDSLSSEIAIYWAITGDESAFAGQLDRIKEVTAADVQRVANTYLVPQKRVVATNVRPANALPDSLNASIETLLSKMISAQVPDVAQAKAVLDQQMGAIKALPKAKREEVLKQLQAQSAAK